MIRLFKRSLTHPSLSLGLFIAGLSLGAFLRFEPAFAAAGPEATLQRAGQNQEGGEGQGERKGARGDDPEERGYPWNRINAGKQNQMLEDVQGVWILKDVRSSELAPSDREINGIALVTPEFFSFELHMEWFNREDSVSDAEFQSGIHQMEINSSSNMVLTQLIGAGLDASGYIDFLPAGERRVYQIQLRSNSMILSRPNGGSFTFKRMRGTGNASKFDLFGRRIREKDEEEEEGSKAGEAKEETPLERWRRERREKLEKDKE